MSTKTNNLFRTLVTTAVLATSATPSTAEQTQPSSGFYLAPIVHAVRTDDDRVVDDDGAFTFAAGAEIHPSWNLELNLFRGRFDNPLGDDLTMDSAGLNLLRVFRRETRFAPYLLIGVGAQSKDRESSSAATNAYADGGLGVLAAIHRSNQDGRALFLRVDGRARYDDADRSRVDYMFGLGLQYAFGSRAKSQSQPSDTTLQPQVAPPPAPSDTDQDGVPDSADRCPSTPHGQRVDTNGCELDSDKDSVGDSVDACPDTEPGTRVDARGCELQTEIQLPLVTFEYNSDRLQSQAFAALDEAVRTLRMNPDLRIEVAGHTDAIGSQAYNLELSQRRADAVRRYLVEKGVTNVLTARGYGEDQPIADNDTDAGRAQNRRVVLRILNR